MKVKQIVGEHKKGMRAKKYTRKPAKYIEPVKPQGPTGPGAEKKDVKETAPGGVVGKVASIDQAQGTANIQGPDGSTKTVDVAQLKPGENNTVTLNTPDIAPGTTVNAEKNMEEGPGVPYYVNTKVNPPMVLVNGNTGGIPLSVTKSGEEITPELAARSRPDWQEVTIEANGKKYTALATHRAVKVGARAFQEITAGQVQAAPVRESDELFKMLSIAGLR